MTNTPETNDGASSRGRQPTGRRPLPRRAQRSVPMRPRMLAAVVAAAVAGVMLLRASAQEQPPAPANLPNEYTIKAVFLYSFGRFVQWPPKTFANPSEPFVIGIAGEDAFGRALDEIAAKKTIQERPIVIRRFATPDDYRGPCQILFVSRSLTAEGQAALLKKTEGRPVFVVGESPGFCQQGGIANFYVEGDRIRFEINAEAARAAQLRLDAKLLKLGKAAVPPQPEATNQGGSHRG